MAELRPNKTLHIANLDWWMNNAYFQRECFDEFQNEIVRITLKEQADGYKYGFIEFSSREVAGLVLEIYRNTRMPRSSGRKFKLNWSKEKTVVPTNAEAEHYILEVVGALPKDVTREELHQFFKAYYPSVKGAGLHFSESLGRYGIVKFGNEHERDLATIQTHMQSFRKREHGESKHFFYKDTATGYQRAAYPSSHLEDADSVQSTIYIQNLKKDFSERVLRDMFSCYGQINKVTLKACAIVQFAYRFSADISDIAKVCMKECASAPIVSDVEDFESMANGSSNRTLCITSVRKWMDEAYFRNKCFPKEFQKNIVKVNIFKEGDLKSGIIEFTSHEIAEKVLETYNIEREKSAWQKVCLSWNKQKWPLQRTNVSEGAISLYIQNLEKEVTEVQLRDVFSQFSPITKVTLQQCALIQFNNRSSADEAELDLKAGLILPVKDLPHDDEGSVSAYSTCNEDFPDEGSDSEYYACYDVFQWGKEESNGKGRGEEIRNPLDGSSQMKVDRHQKCRKTLKVRNHRQPVISRLLEFCRSLWNHFFREFAGNFSGG